MVLWNFHLLLKNMLLWQNYLLWIKLWYYGQKYDTIPKTIELRFMKGKTWWITKNCETFIYNGENNGNITKQW